MKTIKIKGGKITKNELSLNDIELEAMQKIFLHVKSTIASTGDVLKFIKIKAKKGTFIISGAEDELNISMPDSEGEEVSLINEIMKK
ncbi:MAG: hypothetical protein QXS91_00525 [Candidatus Anstonellales archaeon]